MTTLSSSGFSPTISLVLWILLEICPFTGIITGGVSSIVNFSMFSTASMSPGLSIGIGFFNTLLFSVCQNGLELIV